MPNRHPRKFLEDGTANPKWKPRASGPTKPHGSGTRGMHAKRQFPPDFIGVDGEGMTVDGVHRYTLIASSDGSYRYEEAGLSTHQFLDYLCLLHGTFPTSVLCCFSSSYDVNMGLRNLSQEEATTLHKDGRITWSHGPIFYAIEYIPRKLLRVTQWKRGVLSGKFTLFDVFGFFQGSFVSALEKWLGPSYPDLATIRKMKLRRSQFDQSENDAILAYCQMELKALVLLMDKLGTNLKAAGLEITSWIGAGAIASKMLREHRTNQTMEPTIRNYPKVYEAARYAYSGGRIELLKYGFHNGPLYHYDLNSAYVAALPHLPILKDKAWRYEPISRNGNRIVDNRGAIGALPAYCLIRFASSSKIGANVVNPFFLRDSGGYIYYPSSLKEGWAWKPELEAAARYFNGTLRINGYWYPEPSESAFPWIEEVYNLRAQWKREGNEAHLPLKLGLNSIYGKLIQHVGGDEKTKRLPAYHQLEWAGYITSFVRAKLYDAAMQNPDAIVSIQTDGIISTVPLDLPIGGNLGEWTEEKQCYAGLFVQSGVYWLWERGSRNPISYYRGFDPSSLDYLGILAAYKRQERTLPARSTRFITLGSATASESTWPRWRTWRTTDRTLHLSPHGTKRVDKVREYDSGAGIVGTPYRPWAELVPTDANNDILYKDPRTYPYQLPWEHWFATETVDGVQETLFNSEMEETYA